MSQTHDDLPYRAMRAFAVVVCEDLNMLLVGRDARIDQLEAHVRNLEQLVRRIAERAGIDLQGDPA